MRQQIHWFKVVAFGTLGCLVNVPSADDRVGCTL